MNNPLINQRGTAEIAKPTPFVLGARSIMKWLAWICGLCILIQVFLAGLANMIFARFFMILPLLMFILSFIARLPVSLRVHSAMLIVMIILMPVSANLPSGYLAALHPVIALLLLWSTMSIARQTNEFGKSEQRA